MEGESPLLKEGALSLQTSLSHRELSHRTPLLQERKFVSLLWWRGSVGKFFSDWEVRDFLQGAAIALFLWVGNIYETHSTNQSGAKPHRQKNTSRQKRKLPPRAPATKQSETNLCRVQAGALGESFFVAWGDTDFLQGAAIALVWWGTHFADMPCTSAGRRNLGTHVRHNL